MIVDNYHDIYQKICRAGEKYKLESKSLSASDLTKIVRRQFMSGLFRVQTDRDVVVHPDMIVVGGFYDCFDDSQGLPCITISLTYNPEQETYFTNLIDWEQLAFDVAEAVGHEMVHREQHHQSRPGRKYTSRDPDPQRRDEQEYLGHDTEIEAYGFSIAFDSWHRGIPVEISPMYVTYSDVFSHDEKVLLKLQKYISKYLKHLEASSCKTKKS